jgi:inner membrane protein involved in colicin E2 resistance
MVMMLSFFFFVALLSALWKIMGSKIMGSGSKIEYWTSLQACAYTSISLLMLMACDFYVDIVWGYKYSILFSVIFFWGVYILMVISKQVHRIESWNKRIAIGVIGGVIMLPFYYTWLALHHMH